MRLYSPCRTFAFSALSGTIGDIGPFGVFLEAQAYLSLSRLVPARASATAGVSYKGFFVAGSGSYLDDSRLIAYGAPEGRTSGAGTSLGFRLEQDGKTAAELRYTFASNLESYLRFLSGAYDHPIHNIFLSVRF